MFWLKNVQNLKIFRFDNVSYFKICTGFWIWIFSFTRIFGSSEFLVHYYFWFTWILVLFRFTGIFGLPTFLVHYYFRFTDILVPQLFLLSSFFFYIFFFLCSFCFFFLHHYHFIICMFLFVLFFHFPLFW